MQDILYSTAIQTVDNVEYLGTLQGHLQCLPGGFLLIPGGTHISQRARDHE
jgi:hypothetical protein